jgi:predicted TIM-barrel fold metal-dependent hydrolase
MIIDCDAHFTPYLPSSLNPKANAWIKNYNTNKQNQFSDPAQRITEMQLLGVDRQVLNPMGRSLKLFYTIDIDIAADIMRTWNNALSKLVHDYDCFDMNIWLALQDIPASLDEIDRMLAQDFFGIHVGETPLWGFLKEIDPIFEKINQHQIPWYIHLTEEAEDTLPYVPNIPEECIALQAEWADRPWLFTVASLILGGTLDRWPDLKIIVVERDFNWVNEFCQSFVKHGFNDPIGYFRRNFWFTIEPERTCFVEQAISLGTDRLLFATDWPHDNDDSGRNSRHDVEIMQRLNLPQESKDQIMFGNYYNLKNLTI